MSALIGGSYEYETVSAGAESTSNHNWKMKGRTTLKETMRDRVMLGLLKRSNLTQAQFESVLLDQMGTSMTDRRLTRLEMGSIRRERHGISRGSFNRTLNQGRSNISEAIHTVLLLGYAGMLESPGLAPFVEASDRLRTQMEELKATRGADDRLYQKLVDELLGELERASDALQGRES